MNSSSIFGVKSNLNIIFMGTPDFSISPLKALKASRHNIIAIYTQPPRKSGRGMKENKTPVHNFAIDQKIPVFTPVNFKEKREITFFKNLNPDIVIVSAYGLILPSEILRTPKFGCLNIHASILPRWRGAAPIQRSIMEGDKETGITFMLMDEGLDTGKIINFFSTKIDHEKNAKFLHDKLSSLASKNLVTTIDDYIMAKNKPVKQSEKGVTYAEKILKSDCRLDWKENARKLLLKIRGLNPYPGVWFYNNKNKRIKVLDAKIVKIKSDFVSGEVIGNLIIGCGDNALEILTVKPEGKNIMNIKDYLRGNPFEIGEILK